MFFESKSVNKTDLDEKNTVQHRVICDWLRNIDKKLTRIQRQVNLLVENQLSSPEGEPMEYDDSSAGRSAS